jgi:hypothetical protein
MALQLNPQMLKEIAGQLDCGMRCFYHMQTGELESYPDPDRFAGYDSDQWQDVTDKIDADFDNYLCFDPMDSQESFRIMEDFADGMPVGEIRNRFIYALEQRKPFQQFKSLLNYYPDLLQDWYDYKGQRNIEYVKEIAEAHNSKTTFSDG